MHKLEPFATFVVGALTAGVLIWLTQTVPYHNDQHCFELCKSELRKANTLVDIQKPSLENVKKIEDCYKRCVVGGK